MRILKSLAAVAALALSSTAMAADIPAVSAPGPVSAPAFSAPVAKQSSAFSWTGFHVGANAGFVVGDSKLDAKILSYDDTMEGLGFRAKDEAGFTGGGQIGYSVQMGEVVLGVETDLNYFGPSRSYLRGGESVKLEGQYLGTVRPTVGFVVGEGLMAYATGGFAYGKTSAKLSDAVAWEDFSDSAIRTGWALGGGMKYAVTENIVAGGEYLYVNLGRETFNEASTDLLRLTDESLNHVFRARVDYKFD